MDIGVTGIKHIAFAVRDVEEALGRYQGILGAGGGAAVRALPAAGTREAHFMVGAVQYQLCQSVAPDGRFNRFIAERGEGVHHICYTVDDLDAAVARALAGGAALKECASCRVTGRHEHSEGWIAFLADGDVPGADVELMQVYKEGEQPDRYRNRALDR